MMLRTFVYLIWVAAGGKCEIYYGGAAGATTTQNEGVVQCG